MYNIDIIRIYICTFTVTFILYIDLQDLWQHNIRVNLTLLVLGNELSLAVSSAINSPKVYFYSRTNYSYNSIQLKNYICFLNYLRFGITSHLLFITMLYYYIIRIVSEFQKSITFSTLKGELCGSKIYTYIFYRDVSSLT